MATKQTTKKSVLDGFDFEAFRKQKAEVEQAANAAVADKIEQIKALLFEIEQISNDTGLDFYLGEINDTVRSIEYGWSSSNC